MYVPEGFANVHFRFRRLNDDELMLTSFGIEWDTLIGQDTCNEMMAAWADSAMQDNTTNSTALDSVVIDVAVEPGGITIPVESSDAAVPGGSGADPLPNNCAILAKKLTATPGRAGRGRNFYPDVIVTAVDGTGTLESGALASYQAAFEDWGANIDGVTNVTDVVLLHTTDAIPPSPITGSVVQNKIATQRRRMRP